MDLTYVIDGNLKPDFCKDMIEKFEKDTRQCPGHTGGGFNPEMKSSFDLMFSRYTDWEDEVKILDEKIKENLQKYQEFLNERLPNNYDVLNAWHSGYQLQKSGHYRWHHDSRVENGRERIITFIWYLNNIEEGGHTGFLYKSIKPETGKFVFFPSTWDYVHCGFPAKDKYIITGWLWRDYPIF